METRIVNIGGKEYTVREDGEIFKIRGKGFRKKSLDDNGYVRMMFSTKKGPRGRFLHNIVYTAFHGEIPEDYTIDHIDGNKLNNHYTNLQVLTRGDNSVKSNARYWKFISPLGIVVDVYNLEEFCRENGLHAGHMRYVYHEKPSHHQHKGWRKAR